MAKRTDAVGKTRKVPQGTTVEADKKHAVLAARVKSFGAIAAARLESAQASNACPNVPFGAS